MVATAVSSNFLFRQLPPAMLQKVVGYMKRFEFSSGQVVMNEGDMGDNFYVQVERPHTAPNCSSGRLLDCLIARLLARSLDCLLARLLARSIVRLL
eukprot:918639-Prymnesium_polylepis.1